MEKTNGLDTVFANHLCASLWLVFYKLGEQRREIKSVERDLNEFKVAVAKEYATQNHITRLETKIDELRELIWEIHNGTKTTKRHSKQ